MTRSRFPIWAYLVVTALIAGVTSWLIGETRLGVVEPEKVPSVFQGQPIVTATPETISIAMLRTTIRQNLVFGGLLGAAMGLAGALVLGSARRCLVAVILGLTVGSAVSGAVALGVIPIYERHRDDFANDLIPSLLMHCANWCMVGAVAALAFGVGAAARMRELPACVLGAVLGACLGAAIFELLGAVLFATDGTGEPTAGSAGSRLFARVVVALCVAAAIAMVRAPRRAK
jgi:hypothetical protein